jgi:hypothetical protein
MTFGIMVRYQEEPMSGGGKTKPIDNTIKAIPVPYLAGSQPLMLPQGHPGQLEGLARDMAAGGFGTPAADIKWLDQVYDPAETLQFGLPPVKPKTPTTVTKKPDEKARTDRPRQRDRWGGRR